MKGADAAQARRIRELEAKEPKDAEPPREPCTRLFFRDPHQTEADIRAEIDAAKQSGWLRPGDRCVVLSWRTPPDQPTAS